jgi:predicted nucleic acid-binding protein
MIVVDTSALFAVIDARDARHADAVATLQQLAVQDEPTAIPNYVVAESLSLVHRRLGMEHARRLQRLLIAPAEILWTTPLEHATATEQFIESGRALSFVDCATIASMRARGLTRIFTFDEDFERVGFDVL